MTNGDRSGIRREIAVIPMWAFILAGAILVGLPLFVLTVLFPSEGHSSPNFFRYLFPIVPSIFFAFYILMVGYVNQDARKRGMSRTLWTLIVMFVPSGIGFILYFVLRNPVRTPCPNCGATADAGVNYCPKCRYSFNPTCPQCKAAVRTADTFCANCGVQLEQRA